MKPIKQTPTRDTYDFDKKQIIVCKDTFVVPGTNYPEVKIPSFGCVSSKLAIFWWYLLRITGLIQIPFLSADISDMPEEFKRDESIGRALLMSQLQELPYESHVFSYVSESIWKEYQQTGTISGEKHNNIKLHDDLIVPRVNVSERNSQLNLEELGRRTQNPMLAERLVISATYIYMTCMEYARSRGIIIANTTLQFGFDSEKNLCITNDIFTPCTSEMWYVEENGEVKDIFTLNKWIKENACEGGTLPPIPQKLVEQTYQEYIHFYERLTGMTFTP